MDELADAITDSVDVEWSGYGGCACQAVCVW